MKVKLFEDFTKSVKWKCALSDEMKSKINDEINNVLIELVDNGFEIEIEHYAKKTKQNSILVYIHKIDKEVFDTHEIRDNIEILLDYIQEKYGIIEHIFGSNIDSNFNNSVDYPDNLDVIGIDVSIII